MTRQAWILRHNFSTVVDTKLGRWLPAPPERWTTRFRDLADAVGLPVGYAPLIYDRLDWGPQHTDFDTQRLLRTCYFQGVGRDDTPSLEAALEKIGEGDELVLWGDHRLPGCLGLLWAFDWLHAHGAAMDRISLVFDPRKYPVNTATMDDFHRLFAARLPLEEFVRPLVELRRFIASDSDQVEPDLSAFSGVLGEWLQTTRLLTGYLPDERGLDIVDDRLLEYLTDDWRGSHYAVGNTLLALPRSNHDADMVCRRLRELSDYQAWFGGDIGPSLALCELQPSPATAMSETQAHITPEGKSVRSGKCDALLHRYLYRWLGGRVLDRSRDPRYPGSHRQACYVGKPETGEPLKVGEQGTYLQLAARPLPEGLTLRFAPDEDFPAGLREEEEEEEDRRPLTQKGVESARNRSQVVVVEAASTPPTEIDPTDPWPDWQRLRSLG